MDSSINAAALTNSDAPLPTPLATSTDATHNRSAADHIQRPKKPKQKQQPPKQRANTTTATLASPSPPLLALTDLFDLDCNLTHDDLVGDVDGLLERAAVAGVTEMLVPGATLAESRAALALCALYPTRLFPTAGVHPYNAHAFPTPEELSELTALAQLDACRAVGECGLDYSPGFPPAATQRAWFSAQLELAIALDKPLFLHERLACADFVALLDASIAGAPAHPPKCFPPAVVHCFTSDATALATYVERGLYIGVTGLICRNNPASAALRALLTTIPLERLVIETDAPYMGFSTCRNREHVDKKKKHPNVPSALPLVAAAVAAAVGKTPQEIATLTRANARRFLRLS